LTVGIQISYSIKMFMLQIFLGKQTLFRMDCGHQIAF
jgi:hypothetical protein